MADKDEEAAEGKKKGKKKEKGPTVILPGPAPEGVNMSYKVRIYPTKEQAEYLRLNFRATRFVYNHYLKVRKETYEATQQELPFPVVELDKDGNPVIDEDGREVYKKNDKGSTVYEKRVNPGYDPTAKAATFADCSRDVKDLKKVIRSDEGVYWLKDADAVALINAVRNLDNAFQLFFKARKRGDFDFGYPKFKKRSNTGSARFSGQNFKMGEDWIKIPKCEPIKARIHRPILGRVLSVTISVDNADRFFASINVEGAPVAERPKPEANHPVGLAMGIERWAVDSDGNVYERANAATRAAIDRKIEKLQRQLSVKQGFRKGEKKSNRYLRKKRQLARAEAKRADMRADDTHKLTRELVDRYPAVYVRRIDTSKGSENGALQEAPNKVKRAVNRGNRDSNYFEVNRQLAYKCSWAGRGFVELPADKATAKTCNACGWVNEDVADKPEQVWTCPMCGTVHDRKANGALNVLEMGQEAMDEALGFFAMPGGKAPEKR